MTNLPCCPLSKSRAMPALVLACLFASRGLAADDPPAHPRPSIFQVIIHLIFGKDSRAKYYETALKANTAVPKDVHLTAVLYDIRKEESRDLQTPADARSVLLHLDEKKAFYLRRDNLYFSTVNADLQLQGEARGVDLSPATPLLSLIAFTEKKEALLAITRKHALVKIALSERKVSEIRKDLSAREIRILSQESVSPSGAIVFAESPSEGVWQVNLMPEGLESKEVKTLVRQRGRVLLDPRWVDDGSRIIFLRSR